MKESKATLAEVSEFIDEIDEYFEGYKLGNNNIKLIIDVEDLPSVGSDYEVELYKMPYLSHEVMQHLLPFEEAYNIWLKRRNK